MNDDELIDAGSPRLSDLLHRAADGLHVDPARELPIELTPPSDTRRPWLLAAAVLLIVAGLGAAWLLTSGDDGQRLDSGPAEPAVTIAPRVIEDDGIWRLPEAPAEFELVAAELSTGGEMRPELIAVDDPSAPTRWLVLGLGTPQITLDEATTRRPLPDGSELLLVEDPEGARSTRFVVIAPTGEPTANGAAFGVEADELAASIASMGRRPESLQTPDGLEVVWPDELPPSTELPQTLRLTLMGPDELEVVLTLSDYGLPGPLAAVLLRAALEDIGRASGVQVDRTVTVSLVERSDLGPGMWEQLYLQDGMPISRDDQLLALTEDGVAIAATRTFRTDLDPDLRPLSESDQLELINGLVAVSEAGFRERLIQLGVRLDDWTDDGTAQTTTTFVSGDGP